MQVFDDRWVRRFRAADIRVGRVTDVEQTVADQSKRRRRPPRTPDGTMTLIEHLMELRNRIFKAAIVIVLGSIVGIVFYSQILDILKQPYCDLPADHRLVVGSKDKCALIFTGPLEGFFTRIKVGAIAGIILTSPVWLYQLWAFITPGLKKNERKISLIFIVCSTLLFIGGACLAYFTLSKGLRILIGGAGNGTAALLAVGPYISFATAMLLIFGASFEFPLLISMLNMVGALSFERLMKWQRIIIFMVFVFAAIATPSQDPFTMCALAVPMVVLFELAVLVAYFHDKRKSKRQAAESFTDIPDDVASPLDSRPIPIETPDDADSTRR